MAQIYEMTVCGGGGAAGGTPDSLYINVPGRRRSSSQTFLQVCRSVVSLHVHLTDPVFF